MQHRHLKYSELDELVKRYQSGDNEAAEKIIQAFSGYLIRYLQLIKRGNVDTNNAGHRQFIALFVRSKYDRIKIIHGLANSSTRKLIYDTALMISNQFKPYDNEDIMAELTVELLAMAKNYQNDRGHFFHTYVSKVFPFRIFKRLSVWINDITNMIARNYERPDIETFEDEDFSDELIEDLEREDPLLLIPDTSEGTLDENWINGQTCSDRFSKLTPLERRLILLYYQDGYTNKEISEKLGLSVSSICKTKSTAISKLRSTSYACKK